MNKIFIEGIALIEHLKINKKVMFRQFEMEYHYIEATGESIIYANDMNLYLQCRAQDEVIANLNAEAQQKAAEITATIEIHQRQYRKQRLTITRQGEIIDAQKSQIDAQKQEIEIRENERDVRLEEIESLRRQIDGMNSILRLTAHEFKVPNCVIINSLTAVLENENLENEVREAIEKSIVTSKLLLHIATSMIDYSSLNSDHFAVKKQDFVLKDMVNEVISMIEELANCSNLKLITTFGQHLPEIVHTDPNLLKQILLNLCYNAVKCTKIGYI